MPNKNQRQLWLLLPDLSDAGLITFAKGLWRYFPQHLSGVPLTFFGRRFVRSRRWISVSSLKFTDRRQRFFRRFYDNPTEDEVPFNNPLLNDAINHGVEIDEITYRNGKV